MNSNLFNYLGIGGIDVAYLFIGLLGFSDSADTLYYGICTD